MKSIAPAWQARDYQRQVFVERMLQNIRDEQDRQDDNGLFIEDLLLALIVVLARRGHDLSRFSWAELLGKQTVAMKRLVEGILADAILFGRVEEETNLVIGMIMEKIACSIQTEIVATMEKKQLFSTEEVLGVESATEEIEYEVEE